MSSRIKLRQTSNAVDTGLSVNEVILKDCHSLYTDPENGLITIARDVGLKLLPPRKKINVMLIGNHSAGKSSFINWYIEEHVQRTGVAIETQGFALVTSGKKRETLSGEATLHLYPHFQPLGKIPGVLDYLTTEISTSKQKKFPLCMFIDTPGLVDGDKDYPFDVNSTIIWLGDICDLILVLFDPIGQALCKRTLDVVEKLNIRHSDKIRFYLSKADEAGHETDRQRVMMQIVQELCRRPCLNRSCFDMQTIYIPSQDKNIRCSNQIDEVCRQIEKTINYTVQNTLNTLEKDCERIGHLLEIQIQEDDVKQKSNFFAKWKGTMLGTLGFVLPILIIIAVMIDSGSRRVVNSVLGITISDFLYMSLNPIIYIWQKVPVDYQVMAIAVVMIFSTCLFIISKLGTGLLPTLDKKKKKKLLDRVDFIRNIKHKRKQLYDKYLQQSVSEQDF